MYKQLGDVKRPLLSFSEEKIELQIVEGTCEMGTIVVRSLKGDIPVVGNVFSSHPRMEILTPKIQGTEIHVKYQFHSEGLQEQDFMNGNIYFVTNGGEFEIPFSCIVRRLYGEATTGVIRSMQDFLRLYESNWRESVHIFATSGFLNLLKNSKERLYYREFSKKPISRHNIEEFLIGTGYKERCSFQLSEESAKYLNLTESMEVTLPLHKNGSGFLGITVEYESDFIHVTKNQITDEDFIGDTFDFHFIIDVEKLHGGLNFGTITFRSVVECVTFSICASKPLDLQSDKQKKRQKKHIVKQIMEAYEDYVCNHLVTGQWANITVDLLNQYKGVCDEDEKPFVDLWIAYCKIKNQQKQDASWIMSEVKNNCKDKTSELWAFYLFLSMWVEPDEKVYEKLWNQFLEIYKANQESYFLRYLFLLLEADNPEGTKERYHMIREWEREGMTQIPLFACAYQLVKNEPYLLIRLDGFESRLVGWMCKHQGLTKELKAQIIARTQALEGYRKTIDDILEACYVFYPDEDSLAAICAYRIKHQRLKKSDHAYIARAIEEQIQFAGLYEAYIATMDEQDLSVLPSEILVYFLYNQMLSYRQAAALYVNILSNKEKDATTYERFYDLIRKFIVNEIEKGHIDDNLAVLYSAMLSKELLTVEAAKALARLLYVNRFTCMNPNVQKVIVIQESLKTSREYPLQEKKTYFPIYSNDYVLLLEDCDGRRFVDADSCQLERMMNAGKYMRHCLELAPDELPFLLHHMSGKNSLLHMGEKESSYIQKLVESPQISDEYKCKLGPGFLEYCNDESKSIQYQKYLGMIDFNGLDKDSKKQYLMMLIHWDMLDGAYGLMQTNDQIPLPVELLDKVIQHQLRKDSGEDERLLYFAFECFKRGGRSIATMQYLCANYYGTTASMMELLRTAYAMKLPCTELEERILRQMLFSQEFVGDIQLVFNHYSRAQGDEELRIAYLSYFAYEYMTHSMLIPEEVFLGIRSLLLKGQSLNHYCKLAWLKHYAEHSAEDSDVENQKLAHKLLNEYISLGYYFEFYYQLPKDFLIYHHLYDVVIIECRAQRDSKVVLHYRYESDTNYEIREMNPVLDGIYTTSLFLKPGTKLEYYVVEQGNRKEQISVSAMKDSMVDYTYKNRYSRLKALALDDTEEESHVTRLKEYEMQTRLSKELFRIL